MTNPEKYEVAVTEDDAGTLIHSKPITFDQISKSEFCVSCHQVAVHPGIKLEVVWEQYRNAPASEEGITCQDCHMGKIQGIASGYEHGPAAIVGGVTTKDRKITNHTFSCAAFLFFLFSKDIKTMFKY